MKRSAGGRNETAGRRWIGFADGPPGSKRPFQGTRRRRSPDVDLTVPLPGRHALRAWPLSLDSRLFEVAAERHWPAGEPVLPRLSRSANHGALWFATAAAVAVSRTPRARRAAARGLASLSVASLTINTIGKRTVRRDRPALDPVPLVRRLKRQPITTSFPSGHAASAAAFATGVALESPAWGAVVAPIAVAVALSRVCTGGRRPALRLLPAALAGPFTLPRSRLRSSGRCPHPAHASAQVHRLRLSGLAPGTLLAFDGEVTDVGRELTLEELPEALTVYRPPTESLITRQST